MTKTANINFTVHGDDVDIIDWFEKLCGDSGNFTVERGCVNIGYSHKKIAKKEVKDG